MILDWGGLCREFKIGFGVDWLNDRREYTLYLGPVWVTVVVR